MACAPQRVGGAGDVAFVAGLQPALAQGAAGACDKATASPLLQAQVAVARAQGQAIGCAGGVVATMVMGSANCCTIWRMTMSCW